MAVISFTKWQGAGNDFILVDDRDGSLRTEDAALARRLCDRHFGIGSDGLVLLRAPSAQGMDYHMEFLNPDGSRSFCGNGSRCAYAFHGALTGGTGPARFTAIDGEHAARWAGEMVEVTMRDVQPPERIASDMDLLNTGSPHLVCWVEDPAAVDIIPAAHAHRYSPRFKEAGVNVNFVCWHAGHVEMRTYERGVEAETLSCGTGVTAAAVSAMARGLAQGRCGVRAPGGTFMVDARKEGSGHKDVRLTGPVAEVFRGTVEDRA